MSASEHGGERMNDGSFMPTAFEGAWLSRPIEGKCHRLFGYRWDGDGFAYVVCGLPLPCAEHRPAPSGDR